MSEKKIRVGIRGLAGLLGSRLAAAIVRTSDMVTTVGIVRDDLTTRRLIEHTKFGSDEWYTSIPSVIYVDGVQQDCEALAPLAAGRITFRPIEDLDLATTCDVMVDAATGRVEGALADQYQKFSGPIILQDGAYPTGRLIAPPLVAPSQGGNRWRQGGCFLSGIAPILAPFASQITDLRFLLVMQYDGREADFTIAERLNTVTIADHYLPRFEKELRELLPSDIPIGIVGEGVVQVPGMLHYVVTLIFGLKRGIGPTVVTNILAQSPRVRILPEGLVSSYPLNLARTVDPYLPPISIVSDTIVAQSGAVRCKAFLYYPTLAVLPNIDAIRILVQRLDPLEAMRQTDRDMGFISSL